VLWSTVSIVLNVMVPSVALLTTLALGQRDIWVLSAVFAVVTLASILYNIFQGPQEGNYYLAVGFVNAVDVREWAYCRGVAVALIPDDLSCSPRYEVPEALPDALELPTALPAPS